MWGSCRRINPHQGNEEGGLALLAWIKQQKTRIAAAFLLSAGVLLPSLASLSLLHLSVHALFLSLALCVVMAVLEKRKRFAISGWIAAALSVCLWIGFSDGFLTLRDIGNGLLLTAAGIPSALSYLEKETMLLLTLAVTPLCFWITRRSTGVIPASVLVLALLLLMWLGGQDRWMMLSIPAVGVVGAMAVLYLRPEVSSRRVLAWMLCISTVAFVITPPSGITIEPLKEAADRLRQIIYDRFLFTEPRNIFSLANEGYYPQGITQLGGPAAPTSHPVMDVETTVTVYLKGAVRDQYTGRSWRDSTEGRRYLWSSARWARERERVFNSSLPAESLRTSGLTEEQPIRITMTADSVSSLFVPQRIRDLTVDNSLVPYFNQASEVFVTRDLLEGDSWTVKAALVQAGDPGVSDLLDACAMEMDDAYPEIQAFYTSLPDHLQEQVYAIARNAAEGQNTPFMQVSAIQAWLRTHCSYSLDVPSQPEDMDFVTSFLLQGRKGYCTYFASAMTVLCRMIGLPARYVEGYRAVPGPDGIAHVTGMDAHAWTEVYFHGYGWLTFDPTPPQAHQQNTDQQSSHSPSDEALPSPSPQPLPPESETPQSIHDNGNTDGPVITPQPSPQPDDASRFPWWLAIISVIVGLMWWRIRMTSPSVLAKKGKTQLDRVMIWLKAIDDALCELNLGRRPQETPAEWLGRANGVLSAKPSLASLGESLSLIFYAHAEPLPAEMDALQSAWKSVCSKLRRRQLLHMTLKRAFCPSKRPR